MTRSPACEDLLRGSALYTTKSAGTSDKAVVRVSQDLIDWADQIFVMCERTDKHLTFLKSNFSLGTKQVIDLDLEDFIYTRRDDPNLLEDLKERLSKYISIR